MEVFLVETLPTILGIVFTATIGTLFVRRVIVGVARYASTIEDYGVLILPLLTGPTMRLSEHLIEEFIVQFLPSIVFKLEHQPAGPTCT